MKREREWPAPPSSVQQWINDLCEKTAEPKRHRPFDCELPDTFNLPEGSDRRNEIHNRVAAIVMASIIVIVFLWGFQYHYPLLIF